MKHSFLHSRSLFPFSIFLYLVISQTSFSLYAQPVTDVDVKVDLVNPGAAVSPRLYGIFFEEINHAGDGGLYAELVQNRSFEDDESRPVHWQAVGQVQPTLVTTGLINDRQGHALRLTVESPGQGIANDGYWGMAFRQQTTYCFSFWVKAEKAYKGDLHVTLLGSNGRQIGQTEIPLKLKAGRWLQVKDVPVLALASDPQGRLQLTFTQPGTLFMDIVSLFPPTYKGRKNGCRIDLAEKLEALHPRFMRFPGGCYVEGQTTSANQLHNRFEWKNTIGPLEQRPGHLSVNWGYHITDGFGYHEMLQLAEDLGAEPLFVVNVGLGHGWLQPYDQLDEYIQEALDAIEYANGDPFTTIWGARRAQNGHPQPFHLRLIEVGNENANFDFDTNRDQSDHYFQRYIQFYQAIKARYPEIQVIGNVEAWGTDFPSWRSNHPVDILDEHYYRTPGWFQKAFNKYDSYDRQGPKIYVGEYAVTADYGINGHIAAALGEAVYMQGIERNADIVDMASYAPIFVNEHNPAWQPDMIRFNAAESFGTPSYHVQQMMANNIGTRVIPVDITGATLPPAAGHFVGFTTWDTQAEFRNLSICDNEGNLLFSDLFSNLDPTVWTQLPGEITAVRARRSQWSTEEGVLRQQNIHAESSILLSNKILPDCYTLRLQARRCQGNEGFIIVFGAQDGQNLVWWNLGGWGNSQHAIEYIVDGTKSTLHAAPGHLEDMRWYDVEIQVNGTFARCLLDGQVIHEFSLPERQGIYTSATLDEPSHTLIVKLVNPTSVARNAHLHIGQPITQAHCILLTSTQGTDENNMRRQMNVSPVEYTLPNSSSFGNLDYVVPAFSLNILRLKLP